MINQCRKEIAELLERAQELAELGFRNGHDWKFVHDGLNSPGLLSSEQVVSACVRARDKVFPPVEKEAPRDVEDLYAKGLTAQAIAEAEELATALENSTDPVVQACHRHHCASAWKTTA